jgi:adenylate cyclase
MSDDAAAHTFVFADLAGYTAVTEAHGDELAADIAASFCDVARRLLVDAEGEEVKSLGDGLMLRVPEAAGAVRLGASLVSDTVGHGELGVRVGMHTGPAVHRGGDWFGATVNIAARVAAAARPGEVLVTEATRVAAQAGLNGVVLDPRGVERLRHVAEPLELHAVRVDDPRLPVDPVCHMTLDPALATTIIAHEGVEYRFCSRSCAEAFERDPLRYLAS